VIVGVRDDAFHGLAIVEANPHPQTLHHGGVLVEVKGAVAQVAIEGHDEEDCLGIGGGNGLDLAGFGERETNGVEGMLRVVAKELLDGANLAG